MFLGTNWMEGIVSALLSLALSVSAHITDVFAVEMLYECAHCNLTHGRLENLQHFNTMYWQF